MNKNIREIADRAAKQSPDGYPVTIPYSDVFAQKFAELIVSECMSIAMKSDDNDPFDGGFGLAIANDIKHHFELKQ